MKKPRYWLANLTLGCDDNPQLMRRNDGSLIIMDRDPADEWGESRPCLEVPRVVHVPKSKAYTADDPAQLAFAERVIALLNTGTIQ